MTFHIVPDSSKSVQSVLDEFHGTGPLSKYSPDEVCLKLYSKRKRKLIFFVSLFTSAYSYEKIKINKRFFYTIFLVCLFASTGIQKWIKKLGSSNFNISGLDAIRNRHNKVLVKFSGKPEVFNQFFEEFSQKWFQQLPLNTVHFTNMVAFNFFFPRKFYLGAG